MTEPSRIMEVLLQIRADIRRLEGRQDHEFSEIRDQLRRLDERIDGLYGLDTRIAELEKAK